MTFLMIIPASWSQPAIGKKPNSNWGDKHAFGNTDNRQRKHTQDDQWLTKLPNRATQYHDKQQECQWEELGESLQTFRLIF